MNPYPLLCIAHKGAKSAKNREEPFLLCALVPAYFTYIIVRESRAPFSRTSE